MQTDLVNNYSQDNIPLQKRKKLVIIFSIIFGIFVCCLISFAVFSVVGKSYIDNSTDNAPFIFFPTSKADLPPEDKRLATITPGPTKSVTITPTSKVQESDNCTVDLKRNKPTSTNYKITYEELEVGYPLFKYTMYLDDKKVYEIETSQNSTGILKTEGGDMLVTNDYRALGDDGKYTYLLNKTGYISLFSAASPTGQIVSCPGEQYSQLSYSNWDTNNNSFAILEADKYENNISYTKLKIYSNLSGDLIEIKEKTIQQVPGYCPGAVCLFNTPLEWIYTEPNYGILILGYQGAFYPTKLLVVDTNMNTLLDYQIPEMANQEFANEDSIEFSIDKYIVSYSINRLDGTKANGTLNLQDKIEYLKDK